MKAMISTVLLCRHTIRVNQVRTALLLKQTAETARVSYVCLQAANVLSYVCSQAALKRALCSENVSLAAVKPGGSFAVTI